MNRKPPLHLILLAAVVPWLVATWVVVTPRAARAQSGSLDTAAIDRAIGKAGQLSGEIYKITFPRSDLRVTVNGLAIRPGLALTGWAAFKAVGAEAVSDGDLALTEREVNAVLAKLRAEAITITGIHNHLLGETPRVMFVHFWGRGPAARLASSLKAALALTATPMADSAAASASQDVPGADRIQQTLGLKGVIKGGVLSLSKPRPEPIAMMGVTLAPSMGMATSMNFQAAEAGKVAATGDFVLAGDEVNPVITALRAHGIDVTALHNHMIHPDPELYFMHFWADDTPERVATGLKAGLDAMGHKASDMRH